MKRPSMKNHQYALYNIDCHRFMHELEDYCDYLEEIIDLSCKWLVDTEKYVPTHYKTGMTKRQYKNALIKQVENGKKYEKTK